MHKQTYFEGGGKMDDKTKFPDYSRDAFIYAIQTFSDRLTKYYKHLSGTTSPVLVCYTINEQAQQLIKEVVNEQNDR